MLQPAQNLIRTPSAKKEDRCARFLGECLHSAAMRCSCREVGPGRFLTIATVKRSGGAKSLMLNGHVNIDLLAGEWKGTGAGRTGRLQPPVVRPLKRIDTSRGSVGDVAGEVQGSVYQPNV